MRTRKKEEKENRRKTRFAKGTKERNQRDNQKYGPKKEETAMKKEEKKKIKPNKWYILKIMKKKTNISGGPRLARSHGTWSIACDLPHVLRGNLVVAVSNVHSCSPNLFEFVELTFSC